MLEEVRLLELPIEPDEVGAAQRVEVVDDVGQLAEVRVRPGQGRRLEDPTDDRCDLHGSARRLGQLVDPRQDEGVQALRQLEASHGFRVPNVDPATGDVGHELLRVERVALGSLVDERDEIATDRPPASPPRAPAPASSGRARRHHRRRAGRGRAPRSPGSARSRARRRASPAVDRRGRTAPAARPPTARALRAGRGRARRSSGSPRARGRAALDPRGREGRSARRSSSEVLRSFASNEAVSSESGISRPRTDDSSGARGDQVGVDGRERRLHAGALLHRRRRSPRSRGSDARSRARRSSWRSCRTTGTRRGRRTGHARRALRTNSAMSRDFPIPASAAIPTMQSVAADGLVESGRRAGRARCDGRRAAARSGSCRREARSSDPVRPCATTAPFLPLTWQIRKGLPDVRVPGIAPDAIVDVDLSGRRLGHQPRGEVHRVAEADERPPHRVAVGAASEAPAGDADLDVAGSRRSHEIRSSSAAAAARVASSSWAIGEPKTAVEIRALVAERQLQQVAAVAAT